MQFSHHALTYMVYELNHLIDSGRYDHVTIDEVKNHIRDGSIFQYLRHLAGKDIDLSLILEGRTYGAFPAYYVTCLQAIRDAYGGDERRKWGIENRGLCLLLAWTNELLQQGTGWKPYLDYAGLDSLDTDSGG